MVLDQTEEVNKLVDPSKIELVATTISIIQSTIMLTTLARILK